MADSAPRVVTCPICQAPAAQVRPIGHHRLQFVHGPTACTQWFWRAGTRNVIYAHIAPPDWTRDSD